LTVTLFDPKKSKKKKVGFFKNTLMGWNRQENNMEDKSTLEIKRCTRVIYNRCYEQKMPDESIKTHPAFFLS